MKKFILFMLIILGSSVCPTTPTLQSTYQESAAWGLSVHMDLHNTVYFSRSKEAESLLEDFIKALCRFIDMEPYGAPSIEWFGNGDQEGYTAVQLIETSALTIHTTRYNIYLDLFSCKYYDPEQVAEFCGNYLMANDLDVWVIIRK